jgi:tetratricopeptide (TPR) repeat protein
VIVKDEAGVIERLLHSVRDLIDYWVICDMGSTDGTQALVHESLEGIPGELHERAWVNFGHNRSELLDLARSKADYLLLLDADMTVTDNGLDLRSLAADSYLLRHAEDPEYWIKRLVRGGRHWWYVGATHEYIATDGQERAEKLGSIVIHDHAEGGTRVNKLQRDLRLLLGDLGQEPDNPRTVFYLAQTLRDLGRLDDAIKLYGRRSTMGGCAEEAFYALYQVGVLSDRTGRRDEAVVALFDAWSGRPERAEPLYELSRLFRESKQYQAAHLLSERGIRIRIPGDSMFVHRWMYEWGLLFEYSIAAYWVGQPRAALHACDRLLQMPHLPERYRKQTERNRTYSVNAVRGRQSAAHVSSTGSMPP